MPNVAEMLKNFKDICKTVNLEQHEQDLLFEKYFKYAEDRVLTVLVDLVNFRMQAIKDYNELLTNVLPAEVYAFINTQVRPLVTLCPDKIDHFRVYPRITVDGVALDKEVSILNVQSFFSLFIKDYQQDMTGPGAAKWESKERIDARLNEYVDMPTARALTRFLSLGNKYPDDKIRDFGEKLDTARKPMALLYADKPEDFCVMYGSGPSSCMSHNPMSKDAWAFMNKVNMTPTSFYAYMPWSRGAYLMKQGKVFARTILFADVESVKGNYRDMGYPHFQKELAGNWYHGHIYAANNQAHTELTKALKSNNIHALGTTGKGGHFKPPIDSEFVIPGIPISKIEYGAPFPYFDNMDYYGKGFFASYNNDNKQFTISYKEAKVTNTDKVLAIDNRTGYLASSSFVTLSCAQCKEAIPRGYKTTTTDDGNVYCSEGCCKKAGYSPIFTGNPHPLWSKVVTKSQYVETDDGKLFTNYKAAEAHGYLLPIVEFGILPEETDKLTGRGIQHWCGADGGYYMAQLKPLAGDAKPYQLIPIKEIAFQRTVVYDSEEPLAA